MKYVFGEKCNYLLPNVSLLYLVHDFYTAVIFVIGYQYCNRSKYGMMEKY